MGLRRRLRMFLEGLEKQTKGGVILLDTGR
jgi:hypothetical protein